MCHNRSNVRANMVLNISTKVMRSVSAT
uniref:Uncharacterized protein n=1 Tax=Arundo donax TaxID=35708 RepID=A0A0A9BQ66_ARUDO